jgi:two-component system, OmpR family, phosphate regulon response regulator OmpR
VDLTRFIGTPGGDHMSEVPHVLVVDDDRRIRDLLSTHLGTHGYRVTRAASSAEARRALAGMAYDALVLDVMMPGENGLSLARDLRDQGHETPMLMLSALSETRDRINGLQAGSDDYLVKPFEPEEFLLRLRSLLRRSTPAPAENADIRFGECTFNVQTGELRKGGSPVHLTSRERDIMRILGKSAGRTVSRADLSSQALDEGARAIDVQVTRLRQKIENDPAVPVHLQTVRGQGYCLQAESIA